MKQWAKDGKVKAETKRQQPQVGASLSESMYRMRKHRNKGQPTDYLRSRTFLWAHLFGDSEQGKCSICLNLLPLKHVWSELSDDDDSDETTHSDATSSETSPSGLNAAWQRGHIVPNCAGAHKRHGIA